MSDREVDLRGRLGTFKQMVESGENEEEKRSGSESSSSSDGSNELPEPNLTQFATSFHQRPHVTFESSNDNLLPAVTVTMGITQSPQTANLLPDHSASAAEASTQIPVSGMFQLGASREEEMNVRSQNPLLLFPSPERQKSIRSASASGNTSTYHPPTSNYPLDFRLDSSNISSSRANPQLHHPFSPISTTSANMGSPLFARTNLQPLHLMQEPSPTFVSGAQEYGYQTVLGQGMGAASSSFHPFQPQNMPLQKMKMLWQDNNPSLPNLHPHPFGCFNFPNTIRYFRNSCYDPMYEALGLPVDPHLRMFNARRDNNVDE